MLFLKATRFPPAPDWRATDRLTINLGLRYEVQPGPTERYNRMSGVDLARKNPFTEGGSFVSPLGALGRIVFPGTEGYARNLWDTQWNNFSPRAAAAYRWGSSMVVRGGFGRVYVPSNTGFNANGLIYGTGPYSGGAQVNAYGTLPNGVPIGRFSDARSTIIIPAPGTTQAAALYGNNNAALSVDLLPRDYRNGVVNQWNFFLKRKFGGKWLVGVGYVGSHASDLAWRGYPHPIPALVGKASGAINGANLSTLNLQKPYLSLLGQTVLTNKGRTNYSGLRVKAEHGYSNGLTAMFNYTWSKATGRIGGAGRLQLCGIPGGESGDNVLGRHRLSQPGQQQGLPGLRRDSPVCRGALL